jgi:hypothetical protein
MSFVMYVLLMKKYWTNDFIIIIVIQRVIEDSSHYFLGAKDMIPSNVLLWNFKVFQLFIYNL